MEYVIHIFRLVVLVFPEKKIYLFRHILTTFETGKIISNDIVITNPERSSNIKPKGNLL